MKRLQAGDIDYKEAMAVADVKARIEVDGIKAEKNASILKVVYIHNMLYFIIKSFEQFIHVIEWAKYRILLATYQLGIQKLAEEINFDYTLMHAKLLDSIISILLLANCMFACWWLQNIP